MTNSTWSSDLLRAWLPALLNQRMVTLEKERRQAGVLLNRYLETCTEPQNGFHRDRNPGRILIGANKSGKTVAGIVEDLWWCAGLHPFRKTPTPPVHGRIVCPSLPGTMDEDHVQRDTLRAWCPPGLLRGGSWERAYSVQGHTLWFENGSFLEFLSADQTPVQHSGAGRHFCHLDEECPKAIFTENLARLAEAGFRGEWWITYTPVLGLVWMEEELYQAGLNGTRQIGVYEADIESNRKNLPPGFIEHLAEALSPEDQVVRMRGRYGRRSGLVFDIFGAGHLQDLQIVRE